MDVGDYVTHRSWDWNFWWVAIFRVEGKLQESIKLIYADRDVLYLSVHSLHKISRYAGKDGKVPKIYSLDLGMESVKTKDKEKGKRNCI